MMRDSDISFSTTSPGNVLTKWYALTIIFLKVLSGKPKKGVIAMNKMLPVEKPYHTESDYIALIKDGANFLYKYLKVLLVDLGILLGSVGGLIISGILILVGLFIAFAIYTFVNYGLCYFFWH